MKMTLNKLIANDIINYGMDKTSSNDYIVSLNSYIDDYDEESKKYILDNLDSICCNISANENISDFTYDDNKKEFNMIFYWNNLLDRLDEYVLNTCQEQNTGNNYELEDIKNLAEELLSDESTKNLAIEKIRNYKSRDYTL